MNKSNRKAPELQLALWTEEELSDPRPLPEIIAAGGKDWQAFPLAYHDVDGVRWYAVQDWIAGVALSSKPRDFWLKMQARYSELSTPCRQLAYRAKNSRMYQMDHAQAEHLYNITQRMDTNTGLRNKVLAYLSRSGVTLDEIRRDPDKVTDLVGPARAANAGIQRLAKQGHDPAWIGDRVGGVQLRNEFTTKLQQTVIDLTARLFADATDAVYKGTLERTSSQLRRDLMLSPRDSIRDHLSRLALQYIAIAEGMAAKYLGDAQTVTGEQALAIINEVSEFIGAQAKEAAARMGVDLLTGRGLLPS